MRLNKNLNVVLDWRGMNFAFYFGICKPAVMGEGPNLVPVGSWANVSCTEFKV